MKSSNRACCCRTFWAAGFVKANDVLQVRRRGLAFVHPQGKDAGSQRAILGDQLLDVVPELRPHDRMRLGGGFTDGSGRESLRFSGLLLAGLGCREIQRDCLEDLLRGIAQLEWIHGRGCGQGSGRKCLPLREDGLHVANDEVGKSHVLLPKGWRTLRGCIFYL